MELLLHSEQAAPNQRLNIMLKCAPIQRKSKHLVENFESFFYILQVLHFLIFFSLNLNSIFFSFDRDWTGLKTILHEMIESIIEELLQPTENNLIRQSDK